MRTENEVNADIESIKREIRYAMNEEATDTEMETLYSAFDELMEELYVVRSLSKGFWDL